MRALFAISLLVLTSPLVLGQGFPKEYIEGLPDRKTSEVPPAHAYILEQHARMCVATAVIRAGERMLELDGFPETRYVVSWTHFSGRNISDVYSEEDIGMYGSDAALAISEIGFLRWDSLPPYMQRQLEADPLAKFDWDAPGGWKSMYEQYKDKTDKYPIAEPTNVNEIALCLRKGLPVLFISSARWRPVRIRDVDDKGSTRLEFGTTQFNTHEFHVVCLRDYFTLPVFRDGQEYPVEYCNLINSHGEPPLPLKMVWLDWIQQDHVFSCFVILPKDYKKED